MVQVPRQLLGLYEIQRLNFVLYLFCEDLITATCALLATQLNYRQDHFSGPWAEFPLNSQLVWNVEARPQALWGGSHQDQIMCPFSLVWFELPVGWPDSQLASQCFNEEQTLFWSATAEEGQGTGGRCCFWQEEWYDPPEQLVREHLLWKKKMCLLTRSLPLLAEVSVKHCAHFWSWNCYFLESYKWGNTAVTLQTKRPCIECFREIQRGGFHFVCFSPSRGIKLEIVSKFQLE